MKCPNCDYENIVEANFCEQCAAPLGRACANCGNKVPSTAKFCIHCGHVSKADVGDARFASPKLYTSPYLANKILTSRSALEGERKHVTVLFADTKGSMEFFADRDPESAQKLFTPVVERMIEAVQRYEGTVSRVMGDGIMAVFGAPIAHEDHAVRACYAGLRMQEAIAQYSDEIQRSYGVTVAIRVGLNSGEIVIRAIGNDLYMDYTIVGHTANLAARLEQIAKPGSVVTTMNTLQLAEGFVTMQSLGLVPMKGVTHPIEVYEVTGTGDARTRLQIAAGRGLTRFVGREVEWEQLRRMQQLAGRGRGQVVAIVGEAGVGKSRLVREFVRSQLTTGWLVLESNSVSHGRATPYLPIIQLLKDYFQINLQDSTQSIREKVTAKTLELDPSLQEEIPPLLDLLDSLDDGDPFRSLDLAQHRQRTYQAVARLFLSESHVQPVVLIFEDLHWTDPLSLGLLNEVAVDAQDACLLLVVSYRPQYKDEWRSRPNYRELYLHPLASESLDEFMQALLGSDQSLLPLKSFLAERANGNPFFAEEIVRRLADTAVIEGARGGYRLTRALSSIEVPPTVQAVLAARIDALPTADKHLLQNAAVIGHNVPFAVLRSICGLAEDRLRGLLDNLQGAEFLYTTQLFPDPQYSFKHSLTHDVTYSGVLHETRRTIHARVVTAIETLYADRLGEQVDRLAYHAVQGELKEKAVLYLRQAGEKAAARSALWDARASFEKALSILGTLPESRATMEQAFETYLELRPVLRQLGEGQQMLEQLRKAEAIAGRLKDDLRRGQVYAYMTTVLSTFNNLDEALATGTQASAIALRLGDLKLRILSATFLEQAHYYRGEFAHVIELGTDTLTALPSDWVQDYFGITVSPAIFARAWLIMSLIELGRFGEAAKYASEVMPLAEPTKRAHAIGWAYLPTSMLHLFKGDWAKAHSLVERWIDRPGPLDVAVLLPWAVATMAWTLAELGEPSEALNRVREGEQLLERQTARGIVGHRAWGYHVAGHACLRLDLLDDAQRLAERSLESSKHQPGFAAHALHLLGDVATHSDRFDVERGTANYQESLTLAQRHAMLPLVAHCHRGLGKLYCQIGKSQLAQENLAAAEAMYREMEMDFWLERG